MLKFTIMITQTLTGYTTIEATNEFEAIKIANQKYNVQGATLPDMDDSEELEFCIYESAENTCD